MLELKTVTGNKVEIKGNEIVINDSISGAIKDLFVNKRNAPNKIKMLGGIGYLRASVNGKPADIWLDDKNIEVIEKHKNEKRKEEEEKLLNAIPGLRILESAYQNQEKYFNEFSAAMEDEYNDGISMPSKPTEDIDELVAKYPKASVYLEAKGYENSSNFRKASAGREAKELLENGGTIEDAKAILKNWINDCYID